MNAPKYPVMISCELEDTEEPIGVLTYDEEKRIYNIRFHPMVTDLDRQKLPGPLRKIADALEREPKATIN